jgi:predicted dienelactone hydrolase
MTTSWIPDAAMGPVAVRIDKGEWTDAARGGRKVPYKIYRPETMDAAAYPLVIWSHGLGGTRDGAGFLGRYLSSHGYVHAHIQHDGTDDALWRGMPGHPWDNIRKATIPWETVRNRYLDVPFALNNLQGMYEGRLDFSRLGMSGHSFGALTTQVIAGQLAGRETTEDLSDPRIKAGILYSPVPAFRHQIGGLDVYASIKKPLLHMTGSEDASPVEGFGPDRRMEVFEGAGNADQYLFFLNGADHMVYNGSRGQLESYDDIGKHQDMISIVAKAWWDAWLNGDAAARAWLTQDGVSAWLGSEGEFRKR